MTFSRTHTARRGTSTYKSAEGVVIYVPKSVAEHPDQIEVQGIAAPPAKEVKPKMTPEERKAAAAEKRAANASMTPAQKAQAKLDRAQRALEKAQKDAEKASATAEKASAAAA